MRVIVPVLAALLVCSAFVHSARSADKPGVVLMPVSLHGGIPKENRTNYESAVARSLSGRYIVYTGSKVAEVVDRVMERESDSVKEGGKCDLTSCLRKIANEFQVEFIAVTDVTKEDGDYHLSLKVVDVVDEHLEFSDTVSCEKCREAQVLEKLKTLASADMGFVSSAKAGMVFVKGGCFQMGSNDVGADGKPVHRVCLDDFFMDRYEVTQAAYQRVMGTNPSYFKDCPDCPVEQVDWNQASAYCAKVGKRLPTEAQWEYSARSGGTDEKYAGTSDENVIGDYAWFNSNSGGKTHPVGKKQPNGLGLYDMSGNVWEWVSDWYDGSYYGKSVERNPTGPSSGIGKVQRGGGGFGSAGGLRTALRGSPTPDYRDGSIGFRCAQ